MKKYKLLIYPHATILTSGTAGLLKAYVEQGGILVMGARTGYKDEYGRCPMRPMPGFAEELCAVRVTDYTHVGPTDSPEYAVWDAEMTEAPIFNDILEPQHEAKVLAVFKGNYYDGAPALAVNSIGSGAAYYFGAGFSVNTAGIFLKKLGFAQPYANMVELPETIELAIRKKGGKKYLFLLNYLASDVEINVKLPMTDLLTQKKVSGFTTLEKFGVMVLEKQDDGFEMQD